MSEALREIRCSPEFQPDLSLRAHKVRVFRIVRQRGFSTCSRSSATIKGSRDGLGEDLREAARCLPGQLSPAHRRGYALARGSVAR